MRVYDLSELQKEINFAIQDYNLSFNKLYDFAIQLGYTDNDVKRFVNKRPSENLTISSDDKKFGLLVKLCNYLDIRWWLYEL